ncbi:MAG: LytR C-terminal domain-containing protein [Gemmatimonadaceae bacterium]
MNTTAPRIAVRTLGFGALIAAQLWVSACKRGDQNKAPHPPPVVIDSAVGRAPAGVRIKVEVLNGTRNRGVARRATLYLRDRGFDVVSMGNSGRAQDFTAVLDRSGHPEWARLIAAALGARVIERPDTSRYLDATVLIGADWKPTAEAFYP